MAGDVEGARVAMPFIGVALLLLPLYCLHPTFLGIPPRRLVLGAWMAGAVLPFLIALALGTATPMWLSVAVITAPLLLAAARRLGRD